MLPLRLVALAAVTSLSCAHRAEAPPPSAPALIARLAAALRGDDPDALWNLVASAAQARLDRADFAARFAATRVERERRAAALERLAARDEEPGESASLASSTGPRVDLVHEQDGWRLESPPAARTAASTPADALRLFADALDGRDFEGVTRVLAAARRDDVRRTLGQFTAGLRAHLADLTPASGDRASVSWHDGEHHFRVTLRRENGDWRIDDVNEQ
jgi:hypothetical protein